MLQESSPQAQGRRLGAGAITSLTGVGVLVIFMIQNTQRVRLDFLFWNFTWPLWLLTVASRASRGVGMVRTGGDAPSPAPQGAPPSPMRLTRNQLSSRAGPPSVTMRDRVRSSDPVPVPARIIRLVYRHRTWRRARAWPWSSLDLTACPLTPVRGPWRRSKRTAVHPIPVVLTEPRGLGRCWLAWRSAVDL
jgi:hypothetical protein